MENSAFSPKKVIFLFVIFQITFFFYDPVNSGAVQLIEQNIDKTLGEFQYFIVNNIPTFFHYPYGKW